MSRKWRVAISVFAAIVALLVAGFIGCRYRTAARLSSRVVVRETHHAQVLPFSGYADNGKWFVFSILSSSSNSNRVVRTTLEVDGKPFVDFGPHAEFHPSPDGRDLLVEHGLHAEPFQIIDLDTRRTIPVEVPPGARHMSGNW